MYATGIITEYNPFHNGHIYHIKKTRAITNCDVLICVMSGNFVQRGEPAIIDKHIRCEYALRHGVDLVIELPFYYATQSAFYFAKGAIETLTYAKVKNIVFGSECNNLQLLQNYRKQMSNLQNIEIDTSKSMAYNYGKQLTALPPNDILGINYLYHLQTTNIQPITIQRTNHYHDLDTTASIASASAIRQAIQNKQAYTHMTPIPIQHYPLHFIDDYFTYMQLFLKTTSPQQLESFLLMEEGIQNLFKKNAFQCSNMQEFLQACTSSRYTTSKIRRTILHMLLQNKKKEVQNLPKINHLSILGYNDIGRSYLKYLKQYNIHIATQFKHLPKWEQNACLKTAALYNLSNLKEDYTNKELQPPIYISNL